MRSTSRYLGEFFLAGVILCSAACKNHGTSPQPETPAAATIDELDVSITTISAMYNGMPVYPPIPRPAVISMTLALRNTSTSATFDTLAIERARAYSKGIQEPRFVFQFDIVAAKGGADWNARLQPLEQDTIWCSYGFADTLLTCQDSIYVDVKIVNRTGDSLIVQSPMAKYFCVY